MNQKKALVLGGGGVTGIAWMTGLLYGLSENGFTLADFSCVYGTSAGSTVGAQITSGLSLAQLYQRQIDSKLQNHELTPKLNKLSFQWCTSITVSVLIATTSYSIISQRTLCPK